MGEEYNRTKLSCAHRYTFWFRNEKIISFICLYLSKSC